MTKKEILEIKKIFNKENSCLSRICGCYVDYEKEKKMSFKEAFLSLPEEVIQKYLLLLKKSFSGSMGKNLHMLDFPLEQEKPDGAQTFLYRLRESELKDDALVELFYDRIIETYPYAENYLILLVHGIYDVPGKASDGLEMFDASDTVYSFVLCCICPVDLSKGGLCYNESENQITERMRDWLVGEPMQAFLFPAFNDRMSDIHSLLYYNKKSADIRPEFIENMLGCRSPQSSEGQKEMFMDLITETLENECNYEVVKRVHENLNELIEETKDEPEPLVLGKPEVRTLFENSGVSEDRMTVFDRTFDAVAGENAELIAANVTDKKKINIKTPNIVINVNPAYSELVQMRVIDGQQCLVIAVDDQIEVNGLPVNSFQSEKQ